MNPIIESRVISHLDLKLNYDLRILIIGIIYDEINNNNIHSAVKLWIYHERRCINKYGHISYWNVSKVTNMSELFDYLYECKLENGDYPEEYEYILHYNYDSKYRLFNQPLNNWNVSNVTNMDNMFRGTKLFNQPLNKWNVSNVTTMICMFDGAESFNQLLNNWNVSNVTNMYHMFGNAQSFNQPLNNWNVSNVTNMEYLFWNAISFNQPLNNWNVKNVTNMNWMFSEATLFNQPLNNWDIGNVATMEYMFNRAESFNQPLNNWNVSYQYLGLNNDDGYSSLYYKFDE